MVDLFYKHINLLGGVIFKKIKKYPTFLLVNSVFKDTWYNFFVPVTDADNFDWDLSKKIIKDQRKSGVKLSYYVKDDLNENYKNKLESMSYSVMGNDTYVYLKMAKKFETGNIHTEEINNKTMDAYIKTAKSCFPGFSSEEAYCRHFLKIAKSNVENDILASNLEVFEDNKFAVFASIYGSKKQNLAYLHNDGTAKEFRRRGFHSEITKIRCNMAFDLGINNIYSILEEGKASYYSYIKLGFKPMVCYYLYTKG